MTTSSVFTNNRSQAVRIPAELRLPDGTRKVNVRAKGNERIISPLDQTWDSFFMDGPQVSDEKLAKSWDEKLGHPLLSYL